VTAVGGVLEDSLANTDWQDEITRTALTIDHNLSLSGGADKLTYYASFGLQDQEGIIMNSSLKRYSGRMNVNQKLLKDRVNLEINLNAAQTVNNRPPSEGNNGASISIIGTALAANPTYPTRDENGNPFAYQVGTNPLRALELAKDLTTTNRLIGNISPSVEIIKGLVYKLNFGIDNSSSVRDLISMPSLAPPQDGRFEAQYTAITNRLIENYLTYTMDKDDHNLSVMAGYSYQKFFLRYRSFSINKFAISELDPINIPQNGQDLTLANNRPGGFIKNSELQSFFARATYQFRDKYLLTATYRADGSSKFGSNNRYAHFPSFSLGWRISEEAFMQSVPLSTLKLRAGWGQIGNQEVDPKLTQALFTSAVASGVTYPIGTGSYPAGTAYARLANPDLQWEVSTQTNVGLDFGLLEGALSGSIDYFNRVSSNFLLKTIPADPIQPAPDTYSNVKDMTITNKGLEIALNYQLKLDAFTVTVGANTTFIRNKVEKSPYTLIPSGTVSGSGLTTAAVNGYINGEPM
jgi:iron complex outermembrane receptor protein